MLRLAVVLLVPLVAVVFGDNCTRDTLYGLKKNPALHGTRCWETTKFIRAVRDECGKYESIEDITFEECLYNPTYFSSVRFTCCNSTEPASNHFKLVEHFKKIAPRLEQMLDDVKIVVDTFKQSNTTLPRSLDLKPAFDASLKMEDLRCDYPDPEKFYFRGKGSISNLANLVLCSATKRTEQIANDLLRMYKELLENEDSVESYEFQLNPELNSFNQEVAVAKTPRIQEFVSLYESGYFVRRIRGDIDAEYSRMLKDMTFKLGTVNPMEIKFGIDHEELFRDYAKELKKRIADSRVV